MRVRVEILSLFLYLGSGPILEGRISSKVLNWKGLVEGGQEGDIRSMVESVVEGRDGVDSSGAFTVPGERVRVAKP